ncbi:MAG: hypothetical protein Q4E05_01630 [Pseudoclavibacter sp.]|nr:hypothetical protein [Pseudoclavibacter sp.]
MSKVEIRPWTTSEPPEPSGRVGASPFASGSFSVRTRRELRDRAKDPTTWPSPILAPAAPFTAGVRAAEPAPVPADSAGPRPGDHGPVAAFPLPAPADAAPLPPNLFLPASAPAGPAGAAADPLRLPTAPPPPPAPAKRGRSRGGRALAALTWGLLGLLAGVPLGVWLAPQLPGLLP